MDHIYLDHNSTTPTRPEVIEAMARCYAAGHANPASQHQPGQQARRVLETRGGGWPKSSARTLTGINPTTSSSPAAGRRRTTWSCSASQIASVGQIANLPRVRQIGNLPHAAAGSSSPRSNMPAFSKRPNTSWNSAGAWIPCRSIGRASSNPRHCNRSWDRLTRAPTARRRWLRVKRIGGDRE